VQQADMYRKRKHGGNAVASIQFVLAVNKVFQLRSELS